MNGKVFVDVNVLIYAHDRQAGTKYVRAQELLQKLWHEKRGVLSTQVLQEFCVNARRKSLQPISRPELREAIRDFIGWETVVNAPPSVLRAMEIEERYQLSFWDAMIVQAAESAGCEILYSEDFAHGREYEGVLVVNPFVESGLEAKGTE
jgi:predicted nucleic acid-binding protein